MGFQFRSGLAGLFLLTAQAALELTAAQDAQLPRLYTNEIGIEDATRRTALGIDDPVAVFAFIFSALPDRVRVYPTENYFYLSFFHNGTRYAGNIRLAAAGNRGSAAPALLLGVAASFVDDAKLMALSRCATPQRNLHHKLLHSGVLLSRSVSATRAAFPTFPH